MNLIVIGVSLSIIGARFRDITQITQSVIQITLLCNANHVFSAPGDVK